MKKFLLLLALNSVLLTGCRIAPEPIDYGSDACHFCSMTIVDRQHGAELVTKKGKTFKFDASECMMNHLKEVGSDKVALFLVNDYNTPGELIDATAATYLISQDIPSPMGEFLSAFQNKKDAETTKEEHGGDLFSWQELVLRFGNK
ncbi:MAG: nitrous oxide reductase accessory protein NosL [Aurantibacter sp.]